MIDKARQVMMITVILGNEGTKSTRVAKAPRSVTEPIRAHKDLAEGVLVATQVLNHPAHCSISHECLLVHHHGKDLAEIGPSWGSEGS